MIYRITGGIFILLLGANYATGLNTPTQIVGIFGIIAGIALLAGI